MVESQKISDKKTQTTDDKQSPALVPKGITIGLAIFSLILSVSGYIIRLMFEKGVVVADVLSHAVILVPAYVVGFPLVFWLGAMSMNKITGTNIQRRNAMTLGWLISCVSILWLMGTYS